MSWIFKFDLIEKLKREKGKVWIKSRQTETNVVKHTTELYLYDEIYFFSSLAFSLVLDSLSLRT